jgi:hypothetical protein
LNVNVKIGLKDVYFKDGNWDNIGLRPMTEFGIRHVKTFSSDARNTGRHSIAAKSPYFLRHFDFRTATSIYNLATIMEFE